MRVEISWVFPGKHFIIIMHVYSYIDVNKKNIFEII